MVAWNTNGTKWKEEQTKLSLTGAINQRWINWGTKHMHQFVRLWACARAILHRLAPVKIEMDQMEPLEIIYTAAATHSLQELVPHHNAKVMAHTREWMAVPWHRSGGPTVLLTGEKDITEKDTEWTKHVLLCKLPTADEFSSLQEAHLQDLPTATVKEIMRCFARSNFSYLRLPLHLVGLEALEKLIERRKAKERAGNDLQEARKIDRRGWIKIAKETIMRALMGVEHSIVEMLSGKKAILLGASDLVTDLMVPIDIFREISAAVADANQWECPIAPTRN